MSKVKVLYVMGYGRSGSTILGNILGELDRVVHVGELRSFWALGILGRRVCGCGVPIRACEAWSTVLKAAYEEPWDQEVDARAVVAWQREVVRMRNIRRLLRAAPGRIEGWPALQSYAAVASRLYGAIAEVAGSPVVVDTSKHVADAAVLHVLPDVDPYFVQLVRDPRAVAYSWQRVMASPGEGGREEMPRHGTPTSGRSWLATNLGAEAVRRRFADRSLLVRYEDFVAGPREVTERILDLIGEPKEGLPFVDDHTVQLGDNHTAGGNPARLSSGPTRIRLDDEWRTGQPFRQRLVATAFGIPLLHRYGYGLWPRAEK